MTNIRRTSCRPLLLQRITSQGKLTLDKTWSAVEANTLTDCGDETVTERFPGQRANHRRLPDASVTQQQDLVRDVLSGVGATCRRRYSR